MFSTTHRIVRCGLTFLCIQEPGISKFCAVCDTEYLNEDVVGRSVDGNGDGSALGGVFEVVSDVFDTCVYCGGKFRS